MTERMDAIAIREYTDNNGEVKTSFSKIGVAFPARNGEGWTVMLDALPVSGKLLLRPPKPKDEFRDDPQAAGHDIEKGSDFEPDSEIPF